VELSGYKNLREIFRGPRYLVLRANRSSDEAPVVIKTVRPDGPSMRANLLGREYEVLSTLGVADVAKPLALEEEARGLPALVLEDAGPENLSEWLRRNAVGTAAFLDLAIQIATIAAHLHEHNVVHRDINPFNIVVSRNQRLTLIDFDSATTVSGLADTAGVPSELEGTLPYISPEQTGRMNRLVDHRADLYAVGATFYEMLTGRPPFSSLDPIELVHAHLAMEPVPPSQINLAVPAVVSDIVLKLLAKVPEHRYQTAEALLADLKEAQRQFRAYGTVSRFELGLIDFARELPLPEKLYGRDRELAELHGALDRVFAGSRELMLVTGEAGSGKSALIKHLGVSVAERKGWFASGTVDLLHGDVPYAPMVEAFRSLLVTLLGQPKEELSAWRQRLQSAVGPSGRVISTLIPEFERLIGEQPPIPKLAPVETENRFRLVFQAFVRALATSEHPLVLFIDNAHWADSASLALLRVLSTAPDMRYLLLVLAFRPVGSDQPLRQTLDASRDAGALVHQIDVVPLDIASLTALCCEALRCYSVRGRPLAELILRKTAGNPFFVKGLLRSLHQSDLVRFDPALATWAWDLARIEKVGVTDNVAELLVAALHRLPQPTQSVLQIAACIGSRFALEQLASLYGQPMDVTVRTLWTAIREGLVVPLDPSPAADQPGPRYQFAHDRVQQVAYSLLGTDEREAMHLRIGRRLLDRLTDHELEERLFEVVDQLNLGAARVTDDAERAEFARLNSRAAFRARASSAHGSALDYLKRAIAFLPRDAWQSDHDFAFVLHEEAAKFAHLTDPALADELFQTARAHAQSRFEIATLCAIQVGACSAAGDLPEAIQWGRQGLALFGLELPETRVAEAVSKELHDARENLRGRAVHELLHGEQMRDPDKLACMRLLLRLIPPTYKSDLDLFGFVVARMVNLSLLHGQAIQSGYAYVAFGIILESATGDYATGQAFGRLGVELSRHYGHPVYESIALGAFGSLLHVWSAPVRSSVPILREAIAKALLSGNVENAIYCGIAIVTAQFHHGAELSRVLTEVEAGVALATNTNVKSTIAWQLAHRQAVRCLQGHTRERNRFDDGEFDEQSYLHSIAGDAHFVCLYEILRLQTSYLFRDLALARDIALASSRRLGSMHGNILLVDHNFYTSLTLAASHDPKAFHDNPELFEPIEKNQERLDLWATHCPENYRHKHVLVRAELARLRDQPQEAGALYDQAIDASRREGFLQDEALANELAGRFYRAIDRKRIAALYMNAAVRAYARWGATAKADALEEEFPDLESVDVPSWRFPVLPAQHEHPGAALDLLGILKAAESISSEIVLARLLEKLMDVCLATAGAECGALLLEEGGSIAVRVTASVAASAVPERTPLQMSESVPITLVEHVRRTGDVVVLGNAAHEGTFSSDPYIATRSVKSALGVPIHHKAKLLGVLYLENNLATRVFSPSRVRVLQLLSAQIAISLENSLLFEAHQRSEAAIGLLARAGEVLVESLDYETTLNRVAETGVPFLADWCSVHVVDETGEIRRVGTAHVDSAKGELLRASREAQASSWGSAWAARHVIDTGNPVVIPEVTDEVLRQFGFEGRTIDLVRRLGTRTAMLLPLRARGRTFGVLTFCSGSPERRYERSDLALAEELARRAAAAIDNARLYDDAQEAIRARDEFLSIASHELYTPITSLQLLLQGMKSRRVASSSEEARAMALDLADRQTKKLTKLVGELLNVARIRADRLELQLEDLDLASLVRDVVERFSNEMTRMNCPLSVDARAPVVGRWDRIRLEQVVTNLLSNATRFGAGKPIELTVEQSTDAARLIVKDHGIGIPPERVSRIFDRFERAVSVREYGGLGLGLYIVREIVKALGGTISVESVVNVGSTFTVELPLAGPIGKDGHRRGTEATA
jgi:predicted ATPase/signal transduction histidine kinase